MASASAAYFGLYVGFAVFRNPTAAYGVAWVCWAVVLFLTSRIGVFRIHSRRSLLRDALVYALGSVLELVVWSSANNTLNNLPIFDNAPLLKALICSMAPTLLHVVFIFVYMRMIVFRRLFHDVEESPRDAS